MINLFLTLSLLISVVVSFFYYWERRRIFHWLTLKRDFTARLSQLDEMSYNDCKVYVQLISLVFDDLAMVKWWQYQSIRILGGELERLTAILDSHEFFEKTDELGELDGT